MNMQLAVIPPGNTLNLPNLQRQCDEIQYLLCHACERCTDGSITAAERALFKAIEAATIVLRHSVDTISGELELLAGHMESIATLVLHAAGGNHDICSIEKVFVNQLNNFREEAGLPARTVGDAANLEWQIEKVVLAAAPGALTGRENNSSDHADLISLTNRLVDIDLLIKQSPENDRKIGRIDVTTKALYSAITTTAEQACEDISKFDEKDRPRTSLADYIDHYDAITCGLSTIKAVSKIVCAAKEGDYDMASIENIIFTELSNVSNNVRKLAKTALN